MLSSWKRGLDRDRLRLRRRSAETGNVNRCLVKKLGRERAAAHDSTLTHPALNPWKRPCQKPINRRYTLRLTRALYLPMCLVPPWQRSSAVEQGNHNPLVGGSNPSAATINNVFLFKSKG